MKKNAKVLRNVIIAIIILLVGGIYYYIELPALNIHSPGLWKFVLFLIFFGTVLTFCIKIKKDYKAIVNGAYSCSELY